MAKTKKTKTRKTHKTSPKIKKTANNGKKAKKILKSGKIVVTNDVTGGEEHIVDRKKIREDRLTRVGASCGVTINLGNYQTARVGCWVELPCDISQTTKSLDRAFQLAGDRLNKEVIKIKKYRSSKNKTQLVSGDVKNQETTEELVI